MNNKYEPINDYGIIGNLETVALVSKNGSIDWLCLPDFDSATVFAKLLDKDRGGFFDLKPNEKFESSQKYIPKTNILETTLNTYSGDIVKITDFMLPKLKHNSKKAVLIRQIKGIKGNPVINFEFNPKFDYARHEATFNILYPGMITAKDQNNTLILNSDINMHRTEDRLIEDFVLKQGETHWFILTYFPEHIKIIGDYDLITVDNATDELNNTKTFWENWSSGFTYEGPFKENVLRSTLLLKLLIFDETGALISSPTTSIPEKISGQRNWDYRYFWLRNSAFAFHALLNVGFKDEALKLFNWIQKNCKEMGRNIQPVIGIRGERSLIEHNLDHLSGYKDTKPIRIGNDAHMQFELDSYAMLLRCALDAIKNDIQPDKHMTDILIDFTEILSESWVNPDVGIWEMRDGKRQFIFSKVAAWLGIEAGIELIRMLRPDYDRFDILEREKEALYRIIIDRGWSNDRQAFRIDEITDALDASLLLMPILGFLPVTDPRIKLTISKIRTDLSTDSLVYRYKPYKADDGIGEPEGAYTSCSFWLAQNYALLGKKDDAKRIMQNVLNFAGPLKLFSEEIMPQTKENLGNYPFSPAHISFINAALSLA